VWAVFASGAALPVGNNAAAESAAAVGSTACARVLGRASVAGPRISVAWRVGIKSRIGVFGHVPGKTLRPSRWVTPSDAPWLLVLARPHDSYNRCWVLVRLPWRSNNAAGWINANRVVVQKTGSRIEASTTRRTLTLLRAGRPVRTVSVVVGKPSTPTPAGLFAIAWAIPWHPNDFLGSWVLELTAHSDVLQQFDGGDGRSGFTAGAGRASWIRSDPLRATGVFGLLTTRSTGSCTGSARASSPEHPYRSADE
jgi:hypothetical protein